MQQSPSIKSYEDLIIPWRQKKNAAFMSARLPDETGYAILDLDICSTLLKMMAYKPVSRCRYQRKY